jgi:hypothetical protein
MNRLEKCKKGLGRPKDVKNEGCSGDVYENKGPSVKLTRLTRQNDDVGRDFMMRRRQCKPKTCCAGLQTGAQ